MITYRNIVQAFTAWAEGHYQLESFSHGTPDTSTLEKLEQYPLAHLSYLGASYGDRDKTYRLELYLLDGPPSSEEQTREQQTDSVTTMEQIAEDLVADLRRGGERFDWRKYQYQLTSVDCQPLERTTSSELCGVLCSLAITVPYLNDYCNTPQTS